MKQISFGFAFISCVLLVSLLTVSCSKKNGELNLQTDPSTSTAVNKPSPQRPPADPAIVFNASISRGVNSRDIIVMNADGSNQTIIVQGSTGTIWDVPSWAPDGHNFVYTKGPQGLWIVNVTVVNGIPTGSNVHQIPITLPAGTIDPGGPRWSPLGDKIAFSAFDSSSSSGHIYMISPTGGVATIVYTSPAGYSPGGYTWSPDGSKLAFNEEQAESPYQSSLLILDLTTSEITTVTSNNNGVGSPSWSRHGDRIAYSTLNGSTNSIYTVALNNLGALPVKVTDGSEPNWSPDDSMLAFKGSNPSGINSYTFSNGAIKNLYATSGGAWPDWRK